MNTQSPSSSPVTLEREIGGHKHTFTIRSGHEADAEKALDEAIKDNLDLDATKEKLKSYIVKKHPQKSSTPAKAAKTPAKNREEATRGRLASNELRTKITTYFEEQKKEGKDQEDILKGAMKKFKNNDGGELTYANAYYYFDRVWGGMKGKGSKKKK